MRDRSIHHMLSTNHVRGILHFVRISIRSYGGDSDVVHQIQPVGSPPNFLCCHTQLVASGARGTCATEKQGALCFPDHTGISLMGGSAEDV
jgi:hypothetical protein